MTELPLTTQMASGYTDDIAKLLHDLAGSVYFVIKQLTPSHVAQKTNKRNCTLVDFLQQAAHTCPMPNSIPILPRQMILLMASNPRCLDLVQMMPVWFVKQHGDKFHGTVALRSRKCMEPVTVQLSIIQSCKTSLKPPKSPPEIRFGKGWKAFVIRNEVSVGNNFAT